MYSLPYFTESNAELVLSFIKHHPFALITANSNGYPVATQVPLDITETDGRLIFTGHIMKNTDHCKVFETNPAVLAIFNGPHCHVSASWYTNPQVASTWNYMTVHAKGKLTFKNEEETIEIIRDLTNRYEQPGSEARFEKLPEEYVNRLVKAIIGFTIEVESLENVFKLSQNHGIENRKRIIDHLEAEEDDNSRAIAREMQKRINT